MGSRLKWTIKRARLCISKLNRLSFEGFQEKPYSQTTFDIKLTAKGAKGQKLFEVIRGGKTEGESTIVLKNEEFVDILAGEYYSVKNLRDIRSRLVIESDGIYN